MRPRRPPPPSRSVAARLRRTLWRRRYPFVALCLGLAVATGLGVLRPPEPPGEPALVLAADVAAGTPLTGADLVVRTVVAGTVPPSALRDERAALGRPLAVGLPAGTVLMASMLTGPGLADGAPPGTVVVPVPVADAGSARLAQPGQRINLVAAGGEAAGVPGGAEVVARDVVVLAVQESGGGSLLGSGVAGVTFIFVAAPEQVATVLLGSSAWAPLRAVLRP
ncbi:SAF domain-containing protein [Georgenia sp. SYP-B2076]|uniref:SAF domain-containing protein n=1 Tax=Georgenia sp. SYP-B2076 TaxID=2495881 RepID=UPI000F8C55E3|nr:SAF domain-containing protein [Georgenia sp. SYP-B2076]